MSDFSKEYAKLNLNQKEAVDTIDGPVLVVAGPGTGKTQLLGMRAANIVRLTDTLPQNILCLTFTDSAATAMRQRLIELMGPDGNKVAVHTFHSFGSEIINAYPEYFYNGAKFAPADALTTYEILYSIFTHLPHSSPLAKTMNDEFTALRHTQAAISHLKRGGLLPKELLQILDSNQDFCDTAEEPLATFFAARLTKKSISETDKLIKQLTQAYKPQAKTELYGYTPLADLCLSTLQKAAQEAYDLAKTTPLTEWRNNWMQKNHLGEFVFKARKQTKKLRAVAHVYGKYQLALQEQELFDFDDMVSNVAHTLETTPELCYNLQEQYLYFMVDEFQDTNQAQARLLHALTNNPVHEGRPNILAVGDDDQAIYSFQGAQISNILHFKDSFKDTKVVTLTDNYRSTEPILNHARHIITQGTDRLESVISGLNKQLTAHNKTTTSAQLATLNTTDDELRWIASDIKQRVKAGTPTSDIAIIARHHKHLVKLVPYLQAAGIPVQYERRQNALEDPRIQQLITMAETIIAFGEHRYDVAESLLPELLTYPFWRIAPKDIWRLSLTSYKEHRMWIELMIDARSGMRGVAEFLLITSNHAMHDPLDIVLDMIIGTNESQAPDNPTDTSEPSTARPEEEDMYSSPFRDYYFTQQQLAKNPAEYMSLLGNLRAIRRALAAYQPDTVLKLKDFIEFIDVCERTNTTITSTLDIHQNNGVQLMSAHASKGLEFDTVYVLHCQDDVWGRKARHAASSIQFPHNLPLEPAGHHYNEALRLFFVAMTRAKHHLILSAHHTTTDNKNKLLAEFLQEGTLKPNTPTAPAATPAELTPSWEIRHLTTPKVTQEELLQPALQHYQLSATHLNNFIDITRGGPQAFFLQNLLRFPQAITISQVFGRTVHSVLARAHTHLAITKERRPVEDIMHDYELQLQNARLSEHDFNYLLEKGSDSLHTFLQTNYSSFSPSQKAERSFSTQDIKLGNVRLTGIIDLLSIDPINKTLIVTDYKTGKCASSWKGKTDYEKIKLHKYRQQLMFYKLLIEQSRDFSNYTVQKGVISFVEPDDNNQCHNLEMEFNPQDMAEFSSLITAVWQRIMALDMPDTSKYPLTYAGITEFEQDLLKNT